MTDRSPQSDHLPGSVLKSQKPVLQLQAEIAQTKLRLEEMEKALQGHIDRHREQIARSLLARDDTERKLAESIADWWEVPRLKKPPCEQ